MAKRRDDPLLRQKPCQTVALVMLTGQGHNPDQAVRRLQIALELVHIRRDTEPLRLGPLIYPVQIGPLQMNAQNPGTGHLLRS